MSPHPLGTCFWSLEADTWRARDIKLPKQELADIHAFGTILVMIKPKVFQAESIGKICAHSCGLLNHST